MHNELIFFQLFLLTTMFAGKFQLYIVEHCDAILCGKGIAKAKSVPFIPCHAIKGCLRFYSFHLDE